jgi:hypothetical protein
VPTGSMAPIAFGPWHFLVVVGSINIA